MRKIIYTIAKPEVSGWLVAFAAAADILSTAPQVEHEANPIAAWVFAEVGFWPGAILMKLAAVLLIESIAYARKYPDWFRSLMFLIFSCAWFGAALHNINNS